MASKSGKGSEFERGICKLLSQWWCPGRDDIFWRSSQSGGRATQRRKQGQHTANAEGDIGLLDPVGQPFLDHVCLELKRGYGSWSLQDLVEMNDRNKPKVLEFWSQVKRDAKARTARTGVHCEPMLIARKDGKQPIIIMLVRTAGLLMDRMHEARTVFTPYRGTLFSARGRGVELAGMLLSDFLEHFHPIIFLEPLKQKKVRRSKNDKEISATVPAESGTQVRTRRRRMQSKESAQENDRMDSTGTGHSGRPKRQRAVS